MLKLKRALAAITSAALLTACAAGGSAPLPTGRGAAPGKTTTVAFTLKVPGSSIQTKSGRKPLYISRDTKGIGVVFQTHSGSGYTNSTADTAPNAGMAIAPGTGTPCSAAANDGSFSCTVYIAGVPVGYDDFRFTLWNAAGGCAANGTGCNFTGDKAIAVQTLANYAILQGQSNAVPLTATFYPVVDSITESLTAGITDGTASIATLNTVFKDAQGDVILTSDQLLDDTGANLTVTLDISNDGSGACATNQIKGNNCSLYFGTSGSPALANPTIAHATDASTSETITYDGVTQFPTTGSLPQVSVSTSGAVYGTKMAATFVVTSSSSGSLSVPAAPQVGLHPAVASPANIISAADNKLYTISGNNALAQVDPGSGTATNVTLAGDAGDTISGLASGSDGDLWWLDNTRGRVDYEAVGTAPAASTFGTIGITGSETPTAASGGLATPAAPGLTDGGGSGTFANGSTEYVQVTYVNANGESLPSAEASITLGSANDSVVVTSPAASAGATYYRVYASSTSGGERMVSLTPGVLIGTNFQFGSGSNAPYLSSIVSGGDGNMWFTDFANSTLYDVSPNGTTNVTTHPITNIQEPLAAGTFSNGDSAVCYPIGGNTVGCFDITQGAYAIANYTVPSGAISALAFGSDGLLYLGGSKIYSIYETGSGGSMSLNNQVAVYPSSGFLTGGGVMQMVANPYDGSLYIADGGYYIGRIQPESTGNPPATPGTLTEFSLSNVYPGSASAYVTYLAPDVFGQLWAADTGTGAGQLDQVLIHS